MKRFHKSIRQFAALSVAVALLVVLAWGTQGGRRSVLSLLGLEQTARASLTKWLLATRTCVEANVIEVNAGLVPPVQPDGGYVAKCSLPPANPPGKSASRPSPAFIKCILCEPVAAGALDEIGSSDSSGNNEIQATGIKKSFSCGKIFKGTCTEANGVAVCESNDGSPSGVCKEVSTYNRQSTPK